MGSERAHALAERFNQLNNQIITCIDECSAAQWQASCPGERWPVAVTLHHIAQGHRVILDIITAIVTGEPIATHSQTMIDAGNAGNAEHARDYAHCRKHDVLDLLCHNGDRAAAFVENLTDEQLDRAILLFDQPAVSAAFAIDDYLIGHMQRHFQSVSQALSSHP